uniref:C2 domain-containing protein n=1 Tax=Panagrolaimus sp. PS1159 TaxID=55785 RepID=A0AC35FXG3_9BILA
MNRIIPHNYQTTTTMSLSSSSSRPIISLDRQNHHRYQNNNNNNINFRDSNRSQSNSSRSSSYYSMSSKHHNRNTVISLDNSSDEEEDKGFCMDLDEDITTTSGSELLANEAAYIRSKGRKYGGRHIYAISNDSSDSENDFRQQQYSLPHKNQLQRRQQQHQSRPLEMIQEISPVLPDNNSNSDNDSELPPRMPLRHTKEFNPLQTSTLLSLQHPQLPPQHHQHQQQHHQQQQQMYHHHPRPITNPHHNGPTTPSSLYNPISLDGEERIPSLFENQQRLHPISSEFFGLSSMLARKFNSNGILFLEISILNDYLIVTIRNASFYFDKAYHRQVNSYVKVEIKPNPDKQQRRHRRNQHGDDRERNRFEAHSTKIKKRDNRPQYFETFDFKIRRRNREALDFLSISVFIVEETQSGSVCNLLGCMSFPLERLFRKAGNYDRSLFNLKLGGQKLVSMEDLECIL